MSQQGSGERTEKATKKKREKAREQGQVAKSNEVNIAFSVLMLFYLLYVCWDGFIKSSSNGCREIPFTGFSGECFGDGR